MRKLVIAVLVSISLSAFGESIWNGGENVDWSAADSWDGGEPEADGTAMFVTRDTVNSYRVTPPADFVGTIFVTNDQWVTTDYNKRYFCLNTSVDLTVLENAAWTVSGSGAVIASDGLAARLADDFVGVVNIPAGTSFVAPSTLNEKVSFIGEGTLTVTTVAQLDHVDGFSGTIIRAGDAATAPFDSLLQFHGRTFEPADGETLTLAPDMLSSEAVKKIPSPNAQDWVFNTDNPAVDFWGRLDEDHPAPCVREDGRLVLNDTPVQASTAFFTGRTFRLSDDWSVTFKYVMRCPYPSQVSKASIGANMFGYFGFYFSPNDPDGNVLNQVTPMSGGFGWACSQYDSSDGNCGLHWRYNSSDSANNKVDAMNLAAFARGTGKTNEVTVSCIRGVLYATHRNGDATFSMHKSFLSYIKGWGTGYHIGFGARSGGSQTKTFQSWMTAEVLDFRGWYRSRDAAPWQDVSNAADFALNTVNWTNEIQKVADGVAVTNRMDEAYENGLIHLQAGESEFNKSVLRYTHGCAVGLNTVPRAGRYRAVFGLDWTTRTTADNSYWGGLYLGLCMGRDAAYCMAANNGTRYGLARNGLGDMECWQFGVHLEARLRSGDESSVMRASAGQAARSSADGGTMTYRSKSAPARASHQVTYALYYDDYTGRTACEFYSQPTSGAVGGASAAIDYHLFEDPHMIYLRKNTQTMRPAIWTGSDNSYVGTNFRSFSLQELSDNVNPYLDSCVKVADGQTATVKADATHPASATPVATLRAVSVGAGSTLNLATDSTSAKTRIETVEAVCGATIAAAAGETLVIGKSISLSGSIGNTGVTVQGSVSLPSELTVVLPRAWVESRTKFRLLDLAQAQLVGAMPTTIRVFDENGVDMTRKAHVTVDADGIVGNDCPGFIIIFR